MKAATSTVSRSSSGGNSGVDRRLEPAAVVVEGAASCQQCRFYLPRRIHQAAEALGQCRRHAAGPMVQASDWCGDFEERV